MGIQKGIAIVMALAMSTSLAACNGGAGGQTEKPGAQNKDAQAGQQKMVFWDKSEYVKEYNTMMKEKVEEFSEKTGIEVEYVIIPSADQKQKLMAAIEAGNPPDLFVSDDMFCTEFVAMNQIADVTDVVEKLDLTDAAKGVAKVNGVDRLVPMGFLAPGCYWRKDLWDAKGLDKPETWQDLLDDAKVVTDPANGIYGLGFPMGASGGGDAETMMRSLILSYGGVPVDENGNVTINSPETLEALKYMASVFQAGVTPPDAITWDDGGNNSAYLAGTVGVVFNSGSILSALKEENPELLAKTEIMAYPKGASGRNYVPGGTNTFAVFETGKNTQAAKDFVSFLMGDTEYYNTMIEAMGGMWQPVLNGLDDTEFWKEPYNAGWLENSKSLVRTFYPAPSDELANKAFANQLCVKAVQKIVINQMDPQQALDELEAEMKAIYEGKS